MRSIDLINTYFSNIENLGCKTIKIQKPTVHDYNHDQCKIYSSTFKVDLYKEKVYKIIIDGSINVFVCVKDGSIKSPVEGFHQSAYFNNAENADYILWRLKQDLIIKPDYKLSKVSQFDGGTGSYYRWGEILTNFTAGERNLLTLLSRRKEDKNPKTLEEIHDLLEKGYKLPIHSGYGYIFKDIGLKEDKRVNGLDYPELESLKSLRS